MGCRRTEPARRDTATGFGTIPRTSNPYFDAEPLKIPQKF